MRKILALLLAMILAVSAISVVSVSAAPEVNTDLENEKLNELCDLIINAVVKEEMTDVEKAYAVYKWVSDKFSYKMQDKYDKWQDAAYAALSTKSGDCVGFATGTRALLQRLGFETMEVCSPDKSHCWTMAQIGDFWWHIDNTPGWGGDRFMLTTEEILDFEYVDNDKYPDGLKYDFDPEGYPETKGTDKDRVLEKETK